MIVVIGQATANADSFAELVELSRAHVERSRLEPGCRSHDMGVDQLTPYRVLFVERWSDRSSLAAHFGVPESRAFAADLTRLCGTDVAMQMFEVEEISFGDVLG